MMQDSLKLICLLCFSQKFVLHHYVDISVRTLNTYTPACHVTRVDKFIAI